MTGANVKPGTRWLCERAQFPFHPFGVYLFRFGVCVFVGGWGYRIGLATSHHEARQVAR